jgi:hypothetical protein
MGSVTSPWVGDLQAEEENNNLNEKGHFVEMSLDGLSVVSSLQYRYGTAAVDHVSERHADEAQQQDHGNTGTSHTSHLNGHLNGLKAFSFTVGDSVPDAKGVRGTVLRRVDRHRATCSYTIRRPRSPESATTTMRLATTNTANANTTADPCPSWFYPPGSDALMLREVDLNPSKSHPTPIENNHENTANENNDKNNEKFTHRTATRTAIVAEVARCREVAAAAAVGAHGNVAALRYMMPLDTTTETVRDCVLVFSDLVEGRPLDVTIADR